ncbi:MAG: DNA polymerase III subunit epsilon [Betaproteobacteria bacterium]
MTRLVVLDTETTGLNARLGDRVVEIGCIEILDRRVTENRFHAYLNPGRPSEEAAERIHGLTSEFLADKPKFSDVGRNFIDYVRGAEVVIHNAAFDVEFLNQELELAGLGKLGEHCLAITDTLARARELHPGKRNSLDALCERYGVDNSRRTFHGALLDASLLAEVYLAMSRGQESLIVETDLPQQVAGGPAGFDASQLIVVAATAAELAEHEKILAAIDKESKGRTLWRSLEAQE